MVVKMKEAFLPRPRYLPVCSRYPKCLIQVRPHRECSITALRYPCALGYHKLLGNKALQDDCRLGSCAIALAGHQVSTVQSILVAGHRLGIMGGVNPFVREESTIQGCMPDSNLLLLMREGKFVARNHNHELITFPIQLDSAHGLGGCTLLD